MLSVATLGLLPLTAYPGVASAPTVAHTGAARPVTIQNFSFRPATAMVKPGTTVTWTNRDSVAHTATSDTGVFGSGVLSRGGTYSYVFRRAGTYHYHCRIHPRMKGTVTVR